jgi:S1-C subfamily serine protease
MNQQKILSSIVRIHAYGQPRDFAQPYKSADRSKGVGTGTFVVPPGADPNTLYVLTCAHVVDTADTIAVLLPLRSQSEEVEASVVAFIPQYDLALIAIPDIDGSLRQITNVLPIGSSHSLSLGAKLNAYGFPLGQTALKVSDGVYAGFQHLLQHTVSISPGNSGGPLTDSNNRIVGINNSGIVAPEASNIGYAIPIEFFNSQQDRLIGVPLGAPGPERVLQLPTFGFCFHEATDAQVQSTTGGQPCCQTGVFVYKVMADSPAEAAGIKVGDIICKFQDLDIDNTGEVSVDWNYQKVRLEHVLKRAIREDLQYPIMFWSRETGTCKTVLLSPAQLYINGMRTKFPPYDDVDYVAFMGVTVMELCKNHMTVPVTMRTYMKMQPEELQQPHVVVTHLFNGMKAETTAVLSEGDLIVRANGVDVSTLATLRRALQQPVDGMMLTLETERGKTLALSVAEVVAEEDRASKAAVPIYKSESAIITSLRQQAHPPQNIAEEAKHADDTVADLG